jgi:hypothetical protein
VNKVGTTSEQIPKKFGISSEKHWKIIRIIFEEIWDIF